jgi:hypothetical protein
MSVNTSRDQDVDLLAEFANSISSSAPIGKTRVAQLPATACGFFAVTGCLSVQIVANAGLEMTRRDLSQLRDRLPAGVQCMRTARAEDTAAGQIGLGMSPLRIWRSRRTFGWVEGIADSSARV